MHFLVSTLPQVETISAAIVKSSITDLKSLSSSSIATMPGEHSLPSSPALSVKQTRSFDDRESLRTVTSTHETVTTSAPNASCKGIESAKSVEETRKSSENISLHCEINEPNNTNIRHENIAAAQPQQPHHSSANANPNASDTNLESSSCLSDDGGKVHSETIASSASPPTITVICAPCTDDILAETAAQQYTEQPIDCAASDNEETAQTVPSNSKNDTAGTGADAKSSSSQLIQLTLEVRKANDDITIQEAGDLSPSMDEYQECNPISGDYEYDSIAGEMLVPGCVAPAPTPAPLFAPLAEIEVDPPDDDMPVSGIEKPQQSSDATTTIKTESIESTAKPSSQQHHQQSAANQHQPHTSHTKKKKQKSTDKGDKQDLHHQ